MQINDAITNPPTHNKIVLGYDFDGDPILVFKSGRFWYPQGTQVYDIGDANFSVTVCNWVEIPKVSN